MCSAHVAHSSVIFWPLLVYVTTFTQFGGRCAVCTGCSEQAPHRSHFQRTQGEVALSPLADPTPYS